MKSNIDFTKGSIGKQIILFSIPMLIGNVFQQAYSMIDGVIVGRFVGGSALASVGVAMNVTHLFVATLIGLTTGASVVLSQFYGAKQDEDLKRTVATSIVFLSVLSVSMAVFGYLFAPNLLRLLNTTDEIFADALIYLRIMMLGMVFPVFYNMYTAYLRALGDSRSPLYILMGATLLNIILNVIAVALLGFGVMGAAITTIISQAVAAVACYFYARRFVPLLNVKKLAFDQKLFKQILRYGIPAALQMSFGMLAILTITRLINSFGTVAIASIIAAGKVDSLAIMPISNVGMALSTFVGQNIGAGKVERAKKGLRTTLLILIGMAVIISTVLIFFNANLLSLFLDTADVHRTDILALGSQYLEIKVIFYFLFALLVAFTGFLRGVGDAVAAMAMPLISLGIRTLMAYLFVLWLGIGPVALAWSIPLGWASASAISFIYYKSHRWRGKAVVRG